MKLTKTGEWDKKNLDEEGRDNIGDNKDEK